MPHYRNVSADRLSKVPVVNRDETQLPLRDLHGPFCQPNRQIQVRVRASQFVQRRHIVESALVERCDPVTG